MNPAKGKTMNEQLERLPAVIAARAAAAQAAGLEQLHTAIADYAAHPLALATRAVTGGYGSAAPEKPVMVLGKSPAATETERGKMFQGPAGLLVRRAMQDAGYDLEQTYMTSATYWRPRKENTPNATQIAFSRPFLEKEIEIVEPRHIIVLGAMAMDTLYGSHPAMDEAMGIRTQYRGIPVTITRNNGYVLRFPEAYDDFVGVIGNVMEECTRLKAA